MNPLIRLSVVALVALCPLAGTLAETAPGKAVFSDDFDYSGWDTGRKPMMAYWERVFGADPEFVISDDKLPVPYMKPLGSPIFGTRLAGNQKGDFTICAKVLFAMYSRSFWFGLLREDGSAGRVAVWSSALEDQFSGQGWVQIRRVQSSPLPNRESAWSVNSFSVPLDDAKPLPASSGHQGGALAPPFATIELKWDQGPNRWSLFVDGVLISKTEDSESPEQYSHLYFGTGTGVLLKHMSVTSSATTP